MDAMTYVAEPVFNKSFYLVIVLKQQEVLFCETLMDKEEALKMSERIAKRFSEDCILKVVYRQYKAGDHWTIHNVKTISELPCSSKNQNIQFEDPETKH